MRVGHTFSFFVAATLFLLGTADPAYAQEPPVDISGDWFGGGGPSGRVAGPPALSARGQAVSDEFDAAYDPHNQCVQAGLARHLTTPYPMRIEQYPDRVLIIFEEWEIVRTVHLDVEAPENIGLRGMGYSVGYYEGDELVVVTTGLLPGLARLANYFWHTSDQSIIEERFSRTEDGKLFQVAVLTDPLYLAEPWRMERTYGHYEHGLLSFGCELRGRRRSE